MKYWATLGFGFLFGCAFILGMSKARAENTISFSKRSCEPMALLVVSVHDHVLRGEKFTDWPITNVPELKRFFLVIEQVSKQNTDLTSIEVGDAFYYSCLRGTKFTLLPEA